MAEYAGWRNFWWLNVGLLGGTFLICLLGFPETKWHRVHPDELRGVTPETKEQHRGENPTTEEIEGADLEKSTLSNFPDLSHAITAQRDPYIGKGTPSKQQFKFFQPNKHPFKSILLDLWIPWKLFAFPIVEFASFVVSWSASSFLTINLTQSQAFTAPPYNFSPLTVGLFNFAMLIGALIGLATAGPLNDWISMILTKRNKGVREPEMRLPAMIPYVLIMMLGNFIVAFGYQEGWNWKVSNS